VMPVLRTKVVVDGEEMAGVAAQGRG
jgi:hypothetical protein